MGQRGERRWRSQTDGYDGGTYSNPTVVQSRLPGITLSYDFIMLKSYADPTTPIIIDGLGEPGVRPLSLRCGRSIRTRNRDTGEDVKATLQIGLRGIALSGYGMNDDIARPTRASHQRRPSADFS